MYILAGMLVAGFICNMMVKPLADRWFMKPEGLAKLKAEGAASTMSDSFGIGKGGLDAKAAMFWALVGIPLAWGAWLTLKGALAIFEAGS